MTYEKDRDQAYLDRLQDQITDFISSYNANPNPEHTTIFLFPGGLASKLMRAEGAYPNPPAAYDVAWIDSSILGGAFYNLIRSANGDDYQDRFIVPDQNIDWTVLTPYNGFIPWCRSNALDLFIFGWDWRLTTESSADFFLKRFLPLFEERTKACHPNPLGNFWLIGHSFGGLVIKRILNQHANPYVRRLKGAIAVATPFYGYGGQVHRFFVGDPDELNLTEGVEGAQVVTSVISSLPAGYELLFLDSAAYDANKAGLAKDRDGYGLKAYPSIDPQSGARADPYHPDVKQGQTLNGCVRYISDYGFDWTMLPHGLKASAAFAQSLDASVAGRFHTIRGVRGARGAALNDTCVAQTWSLVPSSLDPDGEVDGIEDIFGPGDGTLPAWSTRLVGNKHAQTVWGQTLEHMDMLNYQDVQVAIAKILKPSAAATRRLVSTAKTVKLKAASRKDLNRLLAALGKVPAVRGTSSSKRQAEVRKIVLDQTGGDPVKLRKLAARAWLDALKTPSQRRGVGRKQKTVVCTPLKPPRR